MTSPAAVAHKSAEARSSNCASLMKAVISSAEAVTLGGWPGTRTAVPARMMNHNPAKPPHRNSWRCVITNLPIEFRHHTHPPHYESSAEFAHWQEAETPQKRRCVNKSGESLPKFVAARRSTTEVRGAVHVDDRAAGEPGSLRSEP